MAGVMKKVAKKARSVIRNAGVGKVRAVSVPAPSEGDRLKGRVALLSGGTGGIGIEIAKAFISEGCGVVLGSTSFQKSEDACKALGDELAKPFEINVREVDSLDGKVKDAANLFPDAKGIDILVNCAGVGGKGRFGYVSPDDWDRVLQINLRGSWFLAQSVFNHMVERSIEGNILNVSSSSALRNAKTPYEVSKWGVKGMTLGMAEECIKHGITVNAIAPGPTATAMLGKDAMGNIAHVANPSGRLAVPSEIAQLAVVLVSDMGKLVVGDTLYVTGGAGTICIDR